MTIPKVIGLSGLARSGKGTVAAMLAPHGYTRLPFAGPLKDMLRVLGLSDNELDGARKAEPCDLLMGKTPRHAMQTLGTEWGRDMIGPHLWISSWQRRAVNLPLVVADDVRFPNEALAVRIMGGVIWRIERPGLVADRHASENHTIKADAVIYNDGTLNDLAAQVAWRLMPSCAAA